MLAWKAARNLSGNLFPQPTSVFRDLKTLAISLNSRTGMGFMPDEESIDRRGLTLLGTSGAAFPTTPSAQILETFENRYPHRDYVIRFECADFTSLCPITGQPDFAKLKIEYIADRRCIETKSLKFYLASYRNSRAFNEEVANRILDDMVAVCAPRRMSVYGEFASRGGIQVIVEASHSST